MTTFREVLKRMYEDDKERAIRDMTFWGEALAHLCENKEMRGTHTEAYDRMYVTAGMYMIDAQSRYNEAEQKLDELRRREA